MLISVTRTGGFAGLSETLIRADTETLNTQVAASLRDMVRAMDFFSLPSRVGAEQMGADLFIYEVTVTDGEQSHTVAFADARTPENAPLHDLLGALGGGGPQ
ncbi:MAG TPA: protealysin inhibitor emfourin [Spirochaetia bacterium]|nr:protealysin inhibitor emfourin [Spirochaetia bacterium]